MKKRTKLFLAGIIGIVGNVIAVASASLAFFASVKARSNSADTIAIKASEDATINDLTVYYWDEDTNEGKSIVIDPLTLITETDFSLNEYDTYITSRNPRKARFLKFNITVLTIPTETKAFKAKVACTSDQYEAQDTLFVSKKEWISNIVHFGFYNNNDHSIPTDTGTDTEIYNSCLAEISYTAQFVDTGGSTSATATMTKTKNIDSGSEVQIASGTQNLELILAYNYDPTLVSYYYAKAGKSEVIILGGETIYFDRDITTISFSF